MNQPDADAIRRLLVPPGSPARLSHRDPSDTLGLAGKEATKQALEEDAAAIDLLQDRLFAERRRALLVILQGTDTSGKDGTIRKVFSTTSPLGVTVSPFGVPSEEERAHDYLWRVHLACPRRGMIGIFNRSQYEDVLAVKVHKLAPEADIERRYGQINEFEKTLVENGTTFLKFMLHISKAEQAKRLQERLDEPHKRWKFRAGDLDDRKRWDAFMEAYEIALTRCSTEWAPWYVVPADREWVRNKTVAVIVRETLERMDPKYPVPDWKPGEFRIV
jgi:PPK2 family polyphosphate:nucleotide phosphotransferase